jgi:hypothetical protein
MCRRLTGLRPSWSPPPSTHDRCQVTCRPSTAPYLRLQARPCHSCGVPNANLPSPTTAVRVQPFSHSAYLEIEHGAAIERERVQPAPYTDVTCRGERFLTSALSVKVLALTDRSLLSSATRRESRSVSATTGALRRCRVELNFPMRTYAASSGHSLACRASSGNA